jgi:small subunit ribosomal protein S8
MVSTGAAKRLNTHVTDPVADLLTRIRNANLAYKDEGFIVGHAVEGEGIERVYRVTLKYGARRERAISGLKRISKPGRRVYAQRTELPRVMGGLGIAVLSTSQGVMTDKEAARRRIGGEVLAHVW